MAEVPSREEELQRTSRALRTLSGSNRALLRATDRQELLREICRVVVQEAGYLAASVVQIDAEDPRALKPLAHFGHDEAFADIQTMALSGAEGGHSVTSMAIETGEPCMVNDVQSSPRIAADWRAFHQRHGFGSVLSLPLRVEGRVFGALTILAPEPDAFEPLECEPLREAAADLAFGLETLAARERHAATEEALRRMMLFDPVSGLPNRSHLRQLLAREIATAKASRQPIALIRLAIDRFRELDELLGGSIADRLVEQGARRLEGAIEPGAVLAHVAEAEFAVIVPGAGAEKGRQAAHRLVDALQEPIETDGLQLEARLLAGLAVFPGHAEDPDVLNRCAGIALAHARRSAASVSLFTPELDTGSGHTVSLMADLRKAIPNGELRLYCQPKLALNRRMPCGVEALVRWQHPTRGLLQPQAFIHGAESTGLITSLTHWVLEDTLRQLYAWRESGIQQSVSVNMSAHDLRDPQFLGRVADQLATWGARAGSIEFELTESALMEDPAQALEVLNGLKKLDIKLSIDDFGTGYSSLSYLRRLPVDTLKIDQSFVRSMIADQGCAAIVRSTIELAHNLHLDVIAEGVEDEATVRALNRLGCDAAQGYGIGRPMPAGDYEQWLVSH